LIEHNESAKRNKNIQTDPLIPHHTAKTTIQYNQSTTTTATMPLHLKTPAIRSNLNAGQAPSPAVTAVVSGVIEDIRANGDAAVRRYSEKFDNWSPENFKLSPSQIQDAINSLPKQVIEDIKTVQHNIRTFATAQKESLREFELEIQPGVFLGQRNNPISSVGCYIPGGRYPLLASAHMTILTAKVAGCPLVVGFTPPINGELPAATIAAMHLAGADAIYILGGVQAVAAMALGTETVPRVDFIAGPGNAYVAEAKKQLFGVVGIDLFAGPTEVLIVADGAADPFTCAVDLVSQAEHGPDTPAVLITDSEEVGRKTMLFVEQILQKTELSTTELAGTSWRDYGEVVVCGSMDEAYALADQYASEHVQILTREPREALEKMTNYGALFLGENTCVSYGDKVCFFLFRLCNTSCVSLPCSSLGVRILTDSSSNSASARTTSSPPAARRGTQVACG
jgi:histidinol dehydrogenase